MPVDLGSIAQQIQEEMVRPSTLDIPRIWRAIFDAMEYYSHRRTYFNEAVGSWDTKVDEVSWGPESAPAANDGYPTDMLEVDALYYQQDDAIFWPIDQRPIGFIRQSQDSVTAQGFPLMYAWHNQEIHVDRRAHRIYTFKMDYLRKIEVPVYSYDGAEWTFEDDAQDPVSTNFTNLWLTEADDLIRYRAQTRLARWLKDDAEFGRARLLETEAFQRVKGRSTAYQRPIVTQPHGV